MSKTKEKIKIRIDELEKEIQELPRTECNVHSHVALRARIAELKKLL